MFQNNVNYTQIERVVKLSLHPIKKSLSMKLLLTGTISKEQLDFRTFKSTN